MRVREERHDNTVSIFFVALFVSIFLTIDFSKTSIAGSLQAEIFLDKVLMRFHNFGTINMIIPLCLFFLFLSLKRRGLFQIKNNTLLIIVSCLFGILNSFAQHMYYIDRLPNSVFESIFLGLYALSCTVLFFCIGLIFLKFVPEICERDSIRYNISDRKFFIVSIGMIMTGWLLWMIPYYPGSADWDVYYPISQYLNLMPRSNQQPWLYSVSVGSCYQFGTIIGNKNMGMFIYIVIRAVIMATIYAYLILRLKQYNINKWLIYISILFYAVVPVWGAYAKHAFKDTLGAALFCIYIVSCIDIIKGIDDGSLRIRNVFLYTVIYFFMSLYRNNCIYVAAPTTLFVIIYLIRKQDFHQNKLKICLILLTGIVVFKGYLFFIEKVENVMPGPVAEALSIPLQQTGRTVRDHENEIKEEERQAIAAALDYESLSDLYDPLISDPIKGTFGRGHDNNIRYILTWIRMFPRFPKSYLEAAIAQSYGYYAFTPDQELHAGNWNCGMTIFNWTKDGRFDDSFTCDYVSSMEGIRVALDEWAKLWHELPLLGLTDMKAVYTWTIVLTGIFLIKKKKWSMMIPVGAYMLMILSCCASPVNDCFRYYAPVAAACPALMLLVR